ncbi:MAG: hypothetical protein JWP12_1613 [Bacteroidetes bacterium]|nr:hypothetical protein [Bacteroidota bacterium]
MLYIPVNSFNFNSIFSGESISPGSFYKERKFGSKRFFYNTASPLQSLLLLYNFLPEAESLPVEDDALIFYIGINNGYIHDSIPIDNKGDQAVIGYKDNIYLNFCSPVFVFRDANERNQIIAKSLPSLEAKTIEKYQKQFVTFSELGSSSEKSNLNINVQDDYRVSTDVLKRDEVINAFKGLLYSNIIAKMLIKDNDELTIDNAVRELYKSWRSYVSAVLAVSEEKKYKNNKKGENIEYALNLVGKSFIQLKSIISKHAPINPAEKVKALLDSKGIAEEDINSILRTSSKMPELMQFLYRSSEKVAPSIQFEIDDMQREVIQVSNSYYHNSYKTKIIEKIEKRIENFSQKLSQFKSSSQEPTAADIAACLKDYHLQGDEIKYLHKSNKLDSEQKKLHEYIVNLLWNKNKHSFGEVSGEDINTLIIDVGNRVTELFGEKSRQRLDLITFYNFINGKQAAFDIRSIKSVIISNFAVFVLKYKSFEDLLGYCEQFYIPSYNYAMNYWGSFNGFVSIAKIYVKPLWKKENLGIVAAIDMTLKDELEPLLPQLKTISLAPPINVDNNDEKETSKTIVIYESNPESIDNLLKPINGRSDLKPYLNWIEKCIENCMTSLIIEYENTSALDSLRRELEAELHSKNKPKGFTIKHINTIAALLDFELYEKLKLQKQGFNKS